MKAKEPKAYTLNQVGKALGLTGRCVRNYVKVGLIQLTPWSTYPMMITEEEMQRLKRHGVDNSNITAKLSKLSKRGGTAKTAKKRGKRSAAVSEPAKKRSAYTRKVTKKQVKRGGAVRKATKKKKA